MISLSTNGVLFIDFDGTITKYKKPMPYDKKISPEDLNFPENLKKLFNVCAENAWPCYIVTQNTNLLQIISCLQLLLQDNYYKFITGIYYGKELCKINKIENILTNVKDEKFYHQITEHFNQDVKKILFIDDQPENQLLDENHHLFNIMHFIEVTFNIDFINEALHVIEGNKYSKPPKKNSIDLVSHPMRKKSKEQPADIDLKNTELPKSVSQFQF